MELRSLSDRVLICQYNQLMKDIPAVEKKDAEVAKKMQVRADEMMAEMKSRHGVKPDAE